MQIYRDGTTQNRRQPVALAPDYISADERSTEDLLNFAQAYAKELRFYNESNHDSGDWSRFLNDLTDDNIKAVTACVEAIGRVQEIKETIRNVSRKPHLVLFLAFLHLLRHPQKQFNELTRKHLEFYYKDVLQLKEKSAVPDKVHVIFELAQDVDAHAVKKGTLLNAGKDSQGIDVHYATDDEIVVNKTQIASVKTLYVKKISYNLKEIFERYGGGDKGFERMLRWALGRPKQGDELPNWPDGSEGGTPVDIGRLKILYRDINKKDEKQIDQEKQDYILRQLCFAGLDDFKYCMKILEEGGTQAEWNQVYTSVENAYRKNIDRKRCEDLRKIYENPEHPDKNTAFMKMMEFAFGDPNPGDPLPPMPSDCENVEELLRMSGGSAFTYYVEEHLKMSVGDFRTVIYIKWGEDAKHADEETKKLLNIKRENLEKFLEVKDAKHAGLEELYRLVMNAQVEKRALRYPPIGRKEIQNIYTTSVFEAQQGKPKQFKTFTEIPQTADSQTIIGFAITSPVLLLKEGKRTITLTLVCKENTLDQEKKKTLNQKKFDEMPLFEIFFSSADTWIPLKSPKLTFGQNSIQFKLTLDQTAPAILPPKPGSSTYDLETHDPVLKILLRKVPKEDNKNECMIYYEYFKDIMLEKVNIGVTVTDIQDLQLRNDSAVLSPQSPFEPFGSAPKPGMGFYISNTEICAKKLDSLSINIEWMGLPKDFGEYYKIYSDYHDVEPLQNGSFKAQLKLLLNKTWTPIETPKALFDDRLQHPVSLNYTKEDFAQPGYDIAPSLMAIETDDPLEMPRCFKLELEKPDFQHDTYPIVMTKVALVMSQNLMDSMKDTSAKEPAILVVNPPYTPTIKSISVDYSASAEISLAGKKIGEKSQFGAEKFFHLHPFGYVDILSSPVESINAPDKASGENQPGGYYLMPQYTNEGYVFIGLSNLTPPQNLSILFQLVAGSGNLELEPPEILWSYLSQNCWIDFTEKEVLSDRTNGLVDTGIIRFSVAEKADDRNTLLPGGMHWLRATVKENATAIPDIYDIKTQAVIATFKDQGNAPDHLSRPLGADTIKEFMARDSAIQAIHQPYSSFQGRMKEDELAFYTRVSERLRHKQRALTTWDYERLVLERFPQIYNVKCLNQAEVKQLIQDESLSSSDVTVVVVPDISNTEPFFPLEPKAPQYLLKAIKEYLQAHTSPFVQVIVKNPHYQRIRYEVGIQLKEGYDQGYYLKQLNDELKEFLSPWAYKKDADISFGSAIHNAAVIHFIEKLEYVDYITALKLFEQEEGKNNYKENESGIARVHRPDAILVSAKEHGFYIEKEKERITGIGYMIIGRDFRVA